MKEILYSLGQRLNNKGTILALVGLVLSICIQLGFEVQTEKITNIVQTICTILVTLGVLNDTTDSKEMYIPGISDKLINKETPVNEVENEVK